MDRGDHITGVDAAARAHDRQAGADALAGPPIPPPPGRAAALTARTFSSLRHPAYRLYFAGQFVSLVGMWMQVAAQSWLVYDLTGSKALLGLVGVIGSTPMVLLSTWGGILADRLPRRRILLTCQVLFALQALALAALVFTGTVHVAHVAVLAAFSGILSGLEMPARQAFVIEMVGREDLMNAIALNSSVFHAARILGPAAAGIVIGAAGPGWAFLANGLSYAAIIAALALMRLPPSSPRRSTGTAWSQAVEGFRVVRDTPGMVALLALTLVTGVFGWSYVVLMPAIARDGLSAGPEGYGLLMSAVGAGSVAGALAVATLREVRDGRLLVSGSVLLFSAALAVFALTSSYAVAVAALLPAGFGLTTFFSSTNTLFQAGVGDEVRGRVMGVYTFVFALMMPLGALWAGSLAEAVGSSRTVLLGSAVCAAAAVVALLRMSRGIGR